MNKSRQNVLHSPVATPAAGLPKAGAAKAGAAKGGVQSGFLKSGVSQDRAALPESRGTVDLLRLGIDPRPTPRGEPPPSGPPGFWRRFRQWLDSGATSDRTTSAHEPFLFESDRVVGERYRTLGWMLDQVRQKQSFQVITITSSVAGEGKSTVALNLAAVLAERAEHRVLLIDFDMRRPRVRDLLGGHPPGLQELLEGKCELEQALHQEASLGFSYIPVIVPIEEPLKLLSNTQRLERVIAAARHRFDYVILDAPPILPVSDALFLSEASDAVLFVVRAGETSGRMLSRSLAILRKDKLLGLVFNGTAHVMGYGNEE